MAGSREAVLAGDLRVVCGSGDCSCEGCGLSDWMLPSCLLEVEVLDVVDPGTSVLAEG